MPAFRNRGTGPGPMIKTMIKSRKRGNVAVPSIEYAPSLFLLSVLLAVQGAFGITERFLVPKGLRL